MAERVRRFTAEAAATFISEILANESEEEIHVSDSEISVTNDDFVVEENVEDSDDSTEHENGNRVAMDSEQFISKSGDVWLTRPPPLHHPGRLRQENVLRRNGGVTRYAIQRIHSEMDAWVSVFTDSMLHLITNSTNREGHRVLGENFLETNIIEIRTLIGLIYLRAIYQGTKEPLQNLWSPVHGRYIFRAAMGIHRFKQLLRFLRFDDRSTRNARYRNDKFAPIRELFTEFQRAILQLYWPNQDITVDEQLFPTKNRCAFLQYMPQKPSKFGIKFWLAADSTSHYVLTIQPYLGKEEDRQGTVGESVVLKLTEPFKNSGCNVVTDNFFTSLSLSRSLKQQNMTLLGTMRSNRREIPTEMVKLRNRDRFTSTFAYHSDGDAMIVSYIPKKNKNVLLLSSGCIIDSVDRSTEKQKPDLIYEYNRSKGGVDTVDQMLRHYSTKMASRRWPLAVFCNILDISMLNAYILWREINENKESRFHFIHQVARQMISLQETEQHNEIPLLLNQCSQLSTSKKGNCRFCDRNARNKTTKQCSICEKFICGKHVSRTVYLCDNCNGN